MADQNTKPQFVNMDELLSKCTLTPWDDSNILYRMYQELNGNNREPEANWGKYEDDK